MMCATMVTKQCLGSMTMLPFLALPQVFVGQQAVLGQKVNWLLRPIWALWLGGWLPLLSAEVAVWTGNLKYDKGCKFPAAPPPPSHLFQFGHWSALLLPEQFAKATGLDLQRGPPPCRSLEHQNYVQLPRCKLDLYDVQIWTRCHQKKSFHS